MESISNKQLRRVGPLYLTESDLDALIHEISRIVADGNILMQTGRVTNQDEYDELKKEVMEYEPI